MNFCHVRVITFTRLYRANLWTNTIQSSCPLVKASGIVHVMSEFHVVCFELVLYLSVVDSRDSGQVSSQLATVMT